jgi:vacuolar-type H+-ATPase subunit F/Vma7
MTQLAMTPAAPPIYLGDEVSAAGYRLAGVQALVPRTGQEAAALAQARARAPLVLVSAAVAARIDAAALGAARAALAPLVLVVPDLAGTPPDTDLAARLRLQLGLDA